MSRTRVTFDEHGEVVDYILGPADEVAARAKTVDIMRVLRETDPGPSKDDRYFKPSISDEDAARGWRAMMLAPTLEICQALLRGESVPLDQLRPDWVEWFDIRDR